MTKKTYPDGGVGSRSGPGTATIYRLAAPPRVASSSAPVPAGVSDPYLTALGTVFGQGVAAAYNGHGYLHNWPANPWVKGSYSFYPAGRFTEIAGAEKGRENGVHFAGEHTAPYYRRVTMDGAVVTGERAAAEILAALA